MAAPPGTAILGPHSGPAAALSRSTAVKFPLRYWTRRSALTVALPVLGETASMHEAAEALRARAAEEGWPILGEAFLRLSLGELPAMHLPVHSDTPLCPSDLRVDRIDYGPVVAAFDVAPGDAWCVAEAMANDLAGAGVNSGPVEFHFDPSVGRTNGLLVVPVTEHPADKAAFVSVRRPVAG